MAHSYRLPLRKAAPKESNSLTEMMQDWVEFFTGKRLHYTQEMLVKFKDLVDYAYVLFDARNTRFYSIANEFLSEAIKYILLEESIFTDRWCVEALKKIPSAVGLKGKVAGKTLGIIYGRSIEAALKQIQQEEIEGEAQKRLIEILQTTKPNKPKITIDETVITKLQDAFRTQLLEPSEKEAAEREEKIDRIKLLTGILSGEIRMANNKFSRHEFNDLVKTAYEIYLYEKLGRHNVDLKKPATDLLSKLLPPTKIADIESKLGITVDDSVLGRYVYAFGLCEKGKIWSVKARESVLTIKPQFRSARIFFSIITDYTIGQLDKDEMLKDFYATRYIYFSKRDKEVIEEILLRYKQKHPEFINTPESVQACEEANYKVLRDEGKFISFFEMDRINLFRLLRENKLITWWEKNYAYLSADKEAGGSKQYCWDLLDSLASEPYLMETQKLIALKHQLCDISIKHNPDRESKSELISINEPAKAAARPQGWAAKVFNTIRSATFTFFAMLATCGMYLIGKYEQEKIERGKNVVAALQPLTIYPAKDRFEVNATKFMYNTFLHKVATLPPLRARTPSDDKNVGELKSPGEGDRVQSRVDHIIQAEENNTSPKTFDFVPVERSGFGITA